MHICLVADVKEYAVFIRVIDAVERHGDLHGAETGGQMSAGPGDLFDQFLADLRA